MHHRSLLATTALLLGALVLAPLTPTAAAPADDRPPRTYGGVDDPVRDASGPSGRRSRADVTRVRYRMPLARQGRQLRISTDLRRVGLNDPRFGDSNAPAQHVRTVLDGPGRRDYAITNYNSARSPRVVFLGGAEPRRVFPEFAAWSIGSGKNGTLEVSLSTEWVRIDRAGFTATGVSGRASDPTGTAPRLNLKYAGRTGRGQGVDARGGDVRCESEDGVLSCESGTR